jgi:hypothetical protein
LDINEMVLEVMRAEGHPLNEQNRRAWGAGPESGRQGDGAVKKGRKDHFAKEVLLDTGLGEYPLPQSKSTGLANLETLLIGIQFCTDRV